MKNTIMRAGEKCFAPTGATHNTDSVIRRGESSFARKESSFARKHNIMQTIDATITDFCMQLLIQNPC